MVALEKEYSEVFSACSVTLSRSQQLALESEGKPEIRQEVEVDGTPQSEESIIDLGNTLFSPLFGGLIEPADARRASSADEQEKGDAEKSSAPMAEVDTQLADQAMVLVADQVEAELVEESEVQLTERVEEEPAGGGGGATLWLKQLMF
ncbi:hypothetical protein DPX16_0587 [Anabarilius grahami]|uniref:Uncharacterized protein n=1 Tax=Anabarilius grahami TaxID=495550 RepID=A0A3N0XVU8_ANAGA|nr:hypothetical protein DPX16_0587 [Anabarilius grahami]